LNNWCSHIIKLKDRWLLFQRKEIDEVAAETNVGVEEFNFCPICGAKRPEPQSFRDELSIKLNEQQWSNQVDFKQAADLAIEAVVKKIEEMKGIGTAHYSDLIQRQVLIKELRQ
jgi:hypothetical protein